MYNDPLDIERAVEEFVDYADQCDIVIADKEDRPTGEFIIGFIKASNLVRSALEGRYVDDPLPALDPDNLPALIQGWLDEILAYDGSLRVFSAREDSTLEDLTEEVLLDSLAELYLALRGSWVVVDGADLVPLMRNDPTLFSRLGGEFFEAMKKFEKLLFEFDLWIGVLDRLPTGDSKGEESDEARTSWE